MIRNIIFDWSGTLVNDLPAVFETTNHVFRESGLPEITLETFRDEFCLPFKSFYERYAAKIPLDQLERLFRTQFAKVHDTVTALPHAREFLEACDARGVRTCILSAVPGEHFIFQAKQTGLDRFLHKHYTGVMDKTELIRSIVAENSFHPDETIFIGDMQHDIETAHHGGVLSCAVLTGYNSLRQLRQSEPHLLVEHLGELRRILEKSDWHLERTSHASTRGEIYPVPTVGALIFNSRNEVLMVQTHKWSNLWGIPGGKIKFGESSEDALKREIKEETNLNISNICFVLEQDCIHSREFYKDAHFILLNYTCDVVGHDLVQLNEEAQAFRWLSIERAMELPLNEPTQRLIDAVQRQKVNSASKR